MGSIAAVTIPRATSTVTASRGIASTAAPRFPAAPAAPAAAAAPTASSSSASAAASLFLSLSLQHLSLSLDASLGALTITMSRPALHNAFNEVLIAEMRQVFDTIAAGVAAGSGPLASLRAVVLTGSGASFSAGADLSWMQKMRSYSESENLADATLLFEMIRSIRDCPLPTIARVNGAALGGGVGLVSACDMAFTVSTASFGLTEVKLGLSPAVISSFVMSKISAAAARQYFLTGARFPAEEALRIGLVSRVSADEAALDKLVQSTLEELALNSPAAVRATKSLLGFMSDSSNAPQAQGYVTSLIARLRVSKEGQEGLGAFFEKRKPAWVPAHLGNPKPRAPKGDKPAAATAEKEKKASS